MSDTRAEVDALWDMIRGAVKRLDDLSDQQSIEDGEMVDEDIPEGQILATVAIAYSLTYIDDDDRVQFVTTYLTAPGSSAESTVGIFRIAERQVMKDLVE